MVIHALVLGDSYIRRLGDFVSDLNNGFVNFGFDGTELQVHCYGVGGGTIYTGVKSIQRHLNVVHDYQPHYIFIHIGGNDISDGSDPKTTAHDVVTFSRMLLTSYSPQHVLLGQGLPRFHDDGSFNHKIRIFNEELERSLPPSDAIKLWKHRGFFKAPEALYHHDKIHLNPHGMWKFARSIRSAIGVHHR